MLRRGDATNLGTWRRRMACAVLLLLVACRAEPVLQRKPAAAAVSAAALSASVVAPAPSPSPLASLTLPGEGDCRPDDTRVWYLRLRLRRPAMPHRAALVAMRPPLPGDLRCGEGDEIYLSLSTAEARGLLGAHASFGGLSGAGNATNACAWYASLSPPNFVPGRLAQDVVELSFDTDPKLELIHDLGPCAAPLGRRTRPCANPQGCGFRFDA